MSSALGTSGRFSLGTSSRTGDEEAKDLCLVIMVVQPSASLANAPARIPTCFVSQLVSQLLCTLSRWRSLRRSSLHSLSPEVSAVRVSTHALALKVHV